MLKNILPKQNRKIILTKCRNNTWTLDKYELLIPYPKCRSYEEKWIHIFAHLLKGCNDMFCGLRPLILSLATIKATSFVLKENEMVNFNKN